MNKNIIAAMLACSNMGQKIDYGRVKGLVGVSEHVKNVEEAVDDLCGAFMETEEHDKIFYAEAKMWLKELKGLKFPDIREKWPHIHKLYYDALQEQ